MPNRRSAIRAGFRRIRLHRSRAFVLVAYAVVFGWLFFSLGRGSADAAPVCAKQAERQPSPVVSYDDTALRADLERLAHEVMTLRRLLLASIGLLMSVLLILRH
jgi:cell division protein FtsB